MYYDCIPLVRGHGVGWCGCTGLVLIDVYLVSYSFLHGGSISLEVTVFWKGLL